MHKIGPMELVIGLVVVVLVIGPGRIGRLGRDMGNAIREFRLALTGEKDQGEKGAAGAGTAQIDAPGN